MKIVAANFKTNHTRNSTQAFIQTLNERVDFSDDVQVMVFPSAVSLDAFDSPVLIGAQNAYPVESGSFTGEIGTVHLDEFGIKTILIGHSERRHILGESQAQIAKKYEFFKSLGYTIVYCIGEPLEVKNEGLEATLAYVWEQFEGIDTNYENLILAYEPVWAIGTGVTATMEDIQNVHNAIKEKIDKPLLYGGSVKPANFEEIINIPNVDGGLIGTASWDVESFIQMIQIAQK
jgi:triosephosphate isomerase